MKILAEGNNYHTAAVPFELLTQRQKGDMAEEQQYKGKAWVVAEHDGFAGLKLEHDVPAKDLGERDCLVKIEAASLNYRDIMVAKVSHFPSSHFQPIAHKCTQGTYPFPMASGVVPGSDGAGTIVATGSGVTRFKAGDKVCTTLLQGHFDGALTSAAAQTSLGGSLDGTFRQYGVFDETGLVRMPEHLSFREASTLPCAAVTAWNALYGLPGKALKAGDTVLTLGSGGVSLFTMQLAVAAGATVIATTSSTAKEERLKALGAKHVINYKEDDEWGTTAKALANAGEGVDFVVEVGGATTLSQSVSAIRAEGVIAIVGSIGSDVGAAGDPGLLSVWANNCIARGLAVGSRAHFEAMNRALTAGKIRPVVYEKVFELEELQEAYQCVLEQRGFGKVVVDCW